MSISRAQAIALREKFLDDLGVDPPAGELPIIEATLGLAAKEFIDAASANLDKTSSVSTGELAKALTFAVETAGNTYTLSIGYEKGSKAAVYWDFNNKGVQGVNKPGKAPGSPYKFRFLGVSENHRVAIEEYLRHNGVSAANVAVDYPVGGLEQKRLTLRESMKGKDTDAISSLAYAVGMKSKIGGLKPSNYFDDAVTEVLGPELIEALEVALGGEVIMRIRAYGDNI